MGATHKTIDTPNPAFRSLLVVVTEDQFASNGGIVPPEGTLYGSEAWIGFFGRDYQKNFKDFRYVCQSQSVVGGLIFVRSMTDAQRGTPYRSTTRFGNHRWPPILEALVFVEDDNFQRSTNGTRGGLGSIVLGPTYYVREVYIPECNEGSRFVIQEFFSDVPYDIPPYPVPIATSVSYDIPGARGSFPECLHPLIEIPDTRTASAAVVQGNTEDAGGALRGQRFPETNFTEWSPYVLSDEQEFVNGYKRTRIIVYPPLSEDDEPIIQ